jgi:CubicO group peptidase (beta-lactamase class C family)
MKLNSKYTIIGILALIMMTTSFVYSNQSNESNTSFSTNMSDNIFEDFNPINANTLDENLEETSYQLETYNISQWQSFFDNEMSSVMNDLNIPGMSLSVVNSTNILYCKGYGFADVNEGKLVNPNSTIFRIGSVSKLFTWTAVMQLYEQGLLDLDEDINTYLSAFKIKEKFNLPITMRDLMTHSAGFEADWIWNGDATEETLLSLEEYVIKFQPRRVLPPGEACSYSNYGTSLAGYIVTQLSGLDFDSYVEQNIFIPLGMSSSSFRQPFPEHLKDNYTEVYSFNEDGEPVLSYSELVLAPPAGGLATTALDVALFMMAHLNNGSVDSAQILQQATAEQMHQRLLANDPRLDSGWAYGFVDTTYKGVRILHHGGAVARSGGIIFLIPQFDIGIYMSYNTETVISTVAILANFLERFFPLEPLSYISPSSSSIEDLERFAGIYNQAGVWETTPLKIERVVDYLEVEIDNDGFLIFKGYKFVEVDDLLFRAYNSYWYIAFRENENGEITYLLQGGFTQVPYKKTRGIATPINAKIHMSCIILLFLIGIEYPIRILIEKLRKQKFDQKRTETLISKYSYRFSIFTSFAYSFHLALIFIMLFADFGTNKQFVTALNIVAFLPVFIIPFTGLLLITTLYSWIKNEGTLKNRIIASINLTVTGFYLWFIFFWNFIGFFFNYGVWIPYLG